MLVSTGHPIGLRVAGPAIRAWKIASVLSATSQVKLLSLASISEVEAPFQLALVQPGHEKTFAVYQQWADVTIFHGLAVTLFETLRDSTMIIAADIYDPMQLEQARQAPVGEWKAAVSDATDFLNEHLVRVDFWICASDRQRLFYLDQLAALGRVNPDAYEGSPDLGRLISVVPFLTSCRVAKAPEPGTEGCYGRHRPR